MSRAWSLWGALLNMLGSRGQSGVLILDAAFDNALREEYLKASPWWNNNL